jgi:hypothetical protein
MKHPSLWHRVAVGTAALVFLAALVAGSYTHDDVVRTFAGVFTTLSLVTMLVFAIKN